MKDQICTVYIHHKEVPVFRVSSIIIDHVTEHIGVTLDEGQFISFTEFEPLHIDQLSHSQRLSFYTLCYKSANLRERVIGISGFARSGKDYLAKFIQENIQHDFEFQILPFAKSVYDVRNLVYGESKLKNREQLIMIGEGLRKLISPNVWICAWLRQVFETFDQYNRTTYFIVPDVRLERELLFLESIGAYTIKIEADEQKRMNLIQELDGEVNSIKDITEKGLPKEQFDFVFYNTFEESSFLFEIKRLSTELNKFISLWYVI